MEHPRLRRRDSRQGPAHRQAGGGAAALPGMGKGRPWRALARRGAGGPGRVERETDGHIDRGEETEAAYVVEVVDVVGYHSTTVTFTEPELEALASFLDGFTGWSEIEAAAVQKIEDARLAL